MLKFVGKKLSAVKKNEKGASAVEYALIVGLIAVAIILATTELGTTIAAKFAEIKAAL
ncbi:MAG: Flp family type IVb pilin [Sulfuricurvum sp.]|nr:Flp family type IVb pilin [Sulfuricurvum sp.]